MVQAAHGSTAAGQFLGFVMAAQGFQRDDFFQIQALLVGVQFQGVVAQRDNAGAFAPLFAEFQQAQHGGAILAMQPHADALDPLLGRRLGQQAAAVQINDLLIQLSAFFGVLLAAGLLGQVADPEHIHGAVQVGVPLVAAAAGQDAVPQLVQALGLDHVAETVQDGTQRHIRVAGPFPRPQRIGEDFMGYALTPLQHQILHQRGSLTRLPQHRQYRFAVDANLEIAQHSDFNGCHPVPPLFWQRPAARLYVS